MREPAPISADARRIAIVMPTWVGDCVMATPVLRAVREHRTDAHITAVCRPGMGDVLAGNPWVDDTIIDANRGALGPLKARAAMKSINADWVLLLPNSLRWALTARLANVRGRIGYDRDGRGRLLTHRLTPPDKSRPISTVAYYCDLACYALGVDAIDDAPQLFVSDDERQAARELMRDDERPYLLLNPGANKPAKRWPAERFAGAAVEIAKAHDLTIAATGSPAEAGLIADVMEHIESLGGNAINLIERGITLSALKPIVAGASLLITNDTGPRHFAIALNTPVVALFGPTDHRWTLINCPTERRILAEPFLPAELVADNLPQACAIDRIEVADVVHAADALLQQTVAVASC